MKAFELCAAARQKHHDPEVSIKTDFRLEFIFRGIARELERLFCRCDYKTVQKILLFGSMTTRKSRVLL